jgi:O-acetyl-ADP-ribose deacetylase (regulator of RNase III)
MSVKFKKGNAVSALIDGEVDYLLNCVNCQGKYASGIAKEIRERIPSAYRRYEDFYRWKQGRM